MSHSPRVMSSPFAKAWAMLKAQPEHQLTLPSEIPPESRSRIQEQEERTDTKILMPAGLSGSGPNRQFYNILDEDRQFGTMDPNARAMAERNKVPLGEVRRQPVLREPETAKFYGIDTEDDGNPGSLFGEQEIFHETPVSRQMGGQQDVMQRQYGYPNE